MSSNDAAERFARIQRKEEELKRREAVLREQQLGMEEEKEPNWPSCCPMVYHDIANDIPIQNQTAVRVAFWLDLLWMLCLVVNMVACFGVGALNRPTVYPTSKYIVYGILYALLGVPLGFRINYLRFYDACKENDLGLGWFLLEIIFVAMNVAAAVGIPESGFIGILCAVDALPTDSGYMKLMGWISASLWCLSAVGQCFIGSKAFILYKSMGVPPSQPVPSTA